MVETSNIIVHTYDMNGNTASSINHCSSFRLHYMYISYRWWFNTSFWNNKIFCFIYLLFYRLYRSAHQCYKYICRSAAGCKLPDSSNNLQVMLRLVLSVFKRRQFIQCGLDQGLEDINKFLLTSRLSHTVICLFNSMLKFPNSN